MDLDDSMAEVDMGTDSADDDGPKRFYAARRRLVCFAMWSLRKVHSETTRQSSCAHKFGHLALSLVADYIFNVKHNHRINIIPKTQSSFGGHIS